MRQIAALGLLVGSALLGVLVLITRVVPWWCGVLLIIAFPLGDVVDAAFPVAKASCSPSCGHRWRGAAGSSRQRADRRGPPPVAIGGLVNLWSGWSAATH